MYSSPNLARKLIEREERFSISLFLDGKLLSISGDTKSNESTSGIHYSFKNKNLEPIRFVQKELNNFVRH